jgi:hypothetical protein
MSGYLGLWQVFLRAWLDPFWFWGWGTEDGPGEEEQPSSLN